MEKEKKTYVKYYKIAFKDYKKDLKDLKEEVISKAKEDAGSDKDIDFLDRYKDYKVYDELVDLYNTTYDEAESGNFIPVIGGVVTLCLLGAGGFFFFKKKNNKFKKDNNLA